MCQRGYICQLSHGSDVKETFETATVLKFVSCYLLLLLGKKVRKEKEKVIRYIYFSSYTSKFHSLPSKYKLENFVTVSEHLRTALIKRKLINKGTF